MKSIFCEICLRDERQVIDAGLVFHTHHIVERQNGGSEGDHNLSYLCNECHVQVHKKRSRLHGGSKLPNLSKAVIDPGQQLDLF